MNSRRGHSRGASRGHLGRKGSTPGVTRPRTARKDRPRTYEAYEGQPASRDYLKRLFEAHGQSLSARQIDRFWRYYELLKQHNEQLDLTRILGIEATVLKHFIDSFVVAELISLQGPLLDIGSGPGFPGVPLAIKRPDLPVIVAESRAKRVRFLRILRRELLLDNQFVYPRSVRVDSPFFPLAPDATLSIERESLFPADPEEAAPRVLNLHQLEAAEKPMPIHSVITRALEDIPSTLTRVHAFLPPGGFVIFMKGPNCGQEVTSAQQEFKGRFKMAQDIRYELPGTTQRRRLVVFQRR